MGEKGHSQSEKGIRLAMKIKGVRAGLVLLDP